MKIELGKFEKNLYFERIDLYLGSIGHAVNGS
jgi:hypothetical protein